MKNLLHFFKIKYWITSCRSISFEHSELFRTGHMGVYTGNWLTDVAKTAYMSNRWWNPWKNIIFMFENSTLSVFILMNVGKLLMKCEFLWCLSSEHWNTLWALHLLKREFTYTAFQICLLILSAILTFCRVMRVSVLMLSVSVSQGIYYW